MNKKPHEAPLIYPVEKYSVNVLVGNWFEQRIASFVDPHAVVPILCGKTDCKENMESLYDNSYKKLNSEQRKEFVNDIRDVQFTAENNKSALREVHVGSQVEIPQNDNCTTYELSYRLRSKTSSENRIRPKIKEKPIDISLQDMENRKLIVTRRALKCEKWRQSVKMPVNVTTYLDHYKPIYPKVVPKRFR